MAIYSFPGVCLLTGAASGIGRGTALAVARAGCKRLCLADIDHDGLLETKHQIEQVTTGVHVELSKVNIAVQEDVARMVAACVEAFGRIDYALNVAGIVPQRTPIAQVDVAVYDKTVDVNEYGTWLCHRAEIAQMLQQTPLPNHRNTRGSIVTVSSLAGINASSGMSTYCASKHAIIGYAKADALDYGPRGIRVNVICPGMIDTDLFRATSPPEAPAALAAITPVRRLGDTEDVAALAAFLCSDQASFMQGAVIPCDGGLSLHRGVM